MQDIILHNVLYVPKCSVHLLCPHRLAKSTNSETEGFNSLQDSILNCYRKQISIPYHAGTGLPILLMAPGISNYAELCAATGILTTDSFFSLSPCASIRLRQNFNTESVCQADVTPMLQPQELENIK
jgi:hypothetical protein